jgi:hypothetical protein
MRRPRFPAAFNGIPGARLIAGAIAVNVQLVSRRISQAYAVVVFLFGLLLILLAGLLFRAVHVGQDIATVLFPPGLAFVALSSFIWREKAWANFTAFLLSLLYVVLVLDFSLPDPHSGWLLVIPGLFGAFSVLGTSHKPRF